MIKKEREDSSSKLVRKPQRCVKQRKEIVKMVVVGLMGGKWQK
jgi:hypothetical protein